ncbi:MAG: phosphate acetyltransferase [Candidatus Omnitrophota bacterium]|nr:MAG: phosphate acetyltransferase [Candidatus Omnitrophota bacterium]
MDILARIRERARGSEKRIVLCEAEDKRVISAVKQITQQKIARIVLVGKRKQIEENLLSETSEIEIIDTEEFASSLAPVYYRKKKGVSSLEEAQERLKDPLHLSTFLLGEGKVDGMVAGASRTTAQVLRSLIANLGCKDSFSVSGAFLMQIPHCELGEEGVFIFADCGVIPEPSAKQLANIALASANLFRLLINREPKVAMLSFSTKGSAKHKLIDKVIEATEIAKRCAPDLKIDGEIQADAALIPEIAKCKYPDSEVKGRANVLIFPDLNAGNIAYKLIERLSKARAVGPLLQNLNRPASDLSRGCSVEDIVDVVAITAIRAKEEF